MAFEEYYDEIRERGQLAKCAHFKKSSPRRPKINNYTNREWKKMNGEVVEYSLAKPMTWAELQKLPESAQREYVQNLISTYGIGTTALSFMLGVATSTCSKYVRSTLKLEFSRYSSQKNNSRFITKFCRRKEEEPTVELQEDTEMHEAAPGTETAPMAECSDTLIAEPSGMPMAERGGAAMRLDRTSLEFSGAFDAAAIAQKLTALFDRGARVHISIEIEVGE